MSVLSGVSVEFHLGAVAEALRSAALGEVGWDQAMGALAAATGSKAGELLGLGVSPFHVITEISREELEDLAAIQGHDPSVNSRVRVGMRAPEMRLLDEADFDTEGDSRRNPAYGDLISRVDIPHANLTILSRSPEMTLGLTVLRSAKQGAMPDEQKRLLRAAAPHVLAALKLHMAAESRAMTLTASGFEQAGLPAFVLDRSGRMRAMTTLAEQLVRAGDIRIKDGRLTGREGHDERLAPAIDQARLRRGLSDAAPGVVLTRDADGLAYPLEVMALPSRHGFDFDAGVVVVARPPREVERRAARMAAILFGLTPAEAAVAGLLTAGLSAPDIAQRQGVAVGTIRTHIRHLFEKTGAKNQLALVAAITSRL